MSNEGCSFIEMPSAKVAELAQKCLARIKAHREGEWAEQVARERKSYERSWVHRLFKTEIPSDEAILEGLRRDFSSILIDRYAWGSEEVAERLLNASKFADVIHVSTKDLDMIT